MLYPDTAARRQFAREHQALLAQDARTVRQEKKVEEEPVRSRRRWGLVRRPRLVA